MALKAYPLNIGHFHPVLNHLSLYVHEHGDAYVSKKIAEEGVWEAYETHLISQLLKSGATFVDVGANIGYYSVIASRLVGEQGQVFSFEPEAKNFSLLAENCRVHALDNCCLINAGLAASQGEAQIHLSSDNFGDHQIYDAGLSRSQQTIQLVSGDSFFDQQKPKIDRMDVLKIDTQGAEMQVMSGLKQTLKNSLPDLNMIIEFWPFGLRQSGADAHDLLDFLISLELPMAIIDHINHGLIPCTEEDLRPWINDLDQDRTNEGFMNLLLGHTLL